MPRRCWLPFIGFLACLPSTPLRAQFLNDPSSLRDAHHAQMEWVRKLSSSRKEAADRFLALSEEILALPEGSGSDRALLLTEIQGLAEGITSLDQELLEAKKMVRETEKRAGSLQEELEALRALEGGEVPEDPLEGAASILRGLARVVAEEHRHLLASQTLEEELRLFLGNLRLFDEMSLPPSARSGGEGGQDPGCDPAACAVGGASPADLPLLNLPTEGSGRMGEVGELTPEALAHLHGLILTRVGAGGVPGLEGASEALPVVRETSTGVGFMSFRGDRDDSSALGPRMSGSLVFTRALGEKAGLSVEPSVGGRVLRSGSGTFTELVGELREAVAGTAFEGDTRWQVTAWQKGRFLSEALSPPGYLEPGRGEAGLAARLSLPLARWWALEVEGGADGVRYEPEDWKVLDRQGFRGGLGISWKGASRSAGVSLRGSYHDFPHSPSDWQSSREDTRLHAELKGSLEGSWIASLTVGGIWNDSELPAYDFRMARATLILAAPWGGGRLQGYAALAHQEYLNPGPEEARVAPSDQDSGSVLAIQYAWPLGTMRTLMVRGGWSKSQTGFRDEYYERFGISAHLSFRGR